ncbi:hypothetical protein [Ectobacillus polymachus]
MEKLGEPKKTSKLSMGLTIFSITYLILRFTGLLDPVFAYFKH